MLLFCDSFDHYNSLTTKAWLVSGNNGITAGAGRYRDGGWTRTTSVSGSGGVIGQAVSATAELIVGAAVKPERRDAFRWEFKEGGTVHIAVTINASGFVEIRRGIGGTLLATGSIAITANVWTYLEVRVKINDTTGAVSTQVNAVPDISISGVDTRNGGASGVVDRFDHVTGYLGALVASAYSYLDDLVLLDTSGSVNNAFLGDVRVQALFPDGNGNSSQLVGSDGNSIDNYLLVDENPPDGDTTYVESSTPGDKDTYQYGEVRDIDAGSQVHAVQACMYARQTDSPAVRTIAARSRSAGVEEAGSNKTLTATYKYHLQVFEDDPSSNPWTVASVDAGEFGVEVTA